MALFGNDFPAALNSALKAAKKALAMRSKIVSKRDASAAELKSAQVEALTTRQSLGLIEAQNSLLEVADQPADAKMARRKLAAAVELCDLLEARINGFETLLHASDVELRATHAALMRAQQAWQQSKIDEHRARMDSALAELKKVIGTGLSLTSAMGVSGFYPQWLRSLGIADPFRPEVNLIGQDLRYDGAQFVPLTDPDALKIYEAHREPADIVRALEGELSKLPAQVVAEVELPMQPPMRSYEIPDQDFFGRPVTKG